MLRTAPKMRVPTIHFQCNFRNYNTNDNNVNMISEKEICKLLEPLLSHKIMTTPKLSWFLLYF